jgi:hypothetical protein
MTRARRFTAAAVAILLALAATLVGAAALIVLSNGVLATTAPAWTTPVELLGVRIGVNIPGVVRLATAPGVAWLFDGHSVDTSAGRITLRRDSDAVVARCSPCRWQHPALATVAFSADVAELSAKRSGARVRGRLRVNEVEVDYVAELAADRIVLRWQLPTTDVAAAFRSVASIVPEARDARIGGTVRAQGLIELPGRTGTMRVQLADMEVSGLSTEVLQEGAFSIGCRPSHGAVQRVVTGDGQPRWVPLDRMGSLLPAAIIAAEDQRFHQHAGFDEVQLAAVLADLDSDGPRRGASTLTQQLARTLFTGGERTVARKLSEFLYATEMERTLGKARILELYLNTVDWGPGLCGARSAARVYFRKRPDQLTALEAAWLAGILRAPHLAYADQFLQGAPDIERARWVLMQMRSLPIGERQRAARRPLTLASVGSAGAARTAAPSPALQRNAPIAASRIKGEAQDPAGHALAASGVGR